MNKITAPTFKHFDHPKNNSKNFVHREEEGGGTGDICSLTDRQIDTYR